MSVHVVRRQRRQKKFTKNHATDFFDIKQLGAKNRPESEKTSNRSFKNRPLVVFRFFENRLVSVSVSVSRRALLVSFNYFKGDDLLVVQFEGNL
jgi:hypothetical protein